MNELSRYSTISNRQDSFETASVTGHSGYGGRGLGKGRFADHKKYKKSKSLCTLETNIDDDLPGFGSPSSDNLSRVPSEHELRISKSLQKLNVPNWYKKSSFSRGGSTTSLLKYGSNSTMNSFSFSPSLLSSPCTTPSMSSNVVIKTRVQPPSARKMRSPRYPSSAPVTPNYTAQQNGSSRDGSKPSVKLPSDGMRSKAKSSTLTPIPIVPFNKIRAMFEDKAKNKDEAKTNGNGATSPTSPTSNASPSVNNRTKEPQDLNGEADDDYEDIVVPRVVVSPTEPHVKSILKKPQPQEQRFSDINETSEAEEDSQKIIKPIAKKASPSHSPVFENKNRDTVTEEPLAASRPSTLNYSEPPNGSRRFQKPEVVVEEIQPAENVSTETKPSEKSKSKESNEKPKKTTTKDKALSFFKSLRSSSGSSSDDSSKGKKKKSKSPNVSFSPDTSFDSEDRFPASHSKPGSSSSQKPTSPPPAIIVTPEDAQAKGPKSQPQEPSSEAFPSSSSSSPSSTKPSPTSTMKLEQAPVIQSPPKESKPENVSQKSQRDSTHDEPPKMEFFKPVNERSSDVPDKNNAKPEEPAKVEEVKAEPPKPAPEPEKKSRWFPKPKGWRSSNRNLAADSKSSKSSSKEERVSPKDQKSNFEVGELSMEPRRLKSSNSRSSGLDESFVSDRSQSRESDYDRSRDPYGSRPGYKNREPGRDYAREFSRQSSQNSEKDRSFGQDLDRVLDKHAPKDLERSNGRLGARDSDRSPRDLDRREPPRKTSSFDEDPALDFRRRLMKNRDFDPYDIPREPPALGGPSRRRDRDPADSERDRRREDLDKSYSSRGSSRGNDYTYDSRRASDSFDDNVSRSTLDDTRSSSGRWQPKPTRRSRTADIPDLSRQPDSRSIGGRSIDTNGDSRYGDSPESAYKYRVPGSAFSSSRPSSTAGLNTPPTERREKSAAQTEAEKKSLRETTV